MQSPGGAAALAVLAILVLGSTKAFILDGSQHSFAQFRKWNAGLNGSLELEFKTHSPNGLLLYTDDGGMYDFFELKLVEGALRLRYNLGGGAQILTEGRDLHDGHWHKVAVRRAGGSTALAVDNATVTGNSRGREFEFGRTDTNSDVFVGGMPAWYNGKLTLLALPSVIFEPRFVGEVRNLVYADHEGGAPRRQEIRPKDYKCERGMSNCPRSHAVNGIREKRGIRINNSTDACEEHDPCQNGGICISTDSGPICQCRHLDFEGSFCERDKAPAEATFRGSEYLSYDLNRTGGEPIVSTQDSLVLSFKTSTPNGLLFYTGDGADHLHLALKNGGVLLTMALGNGHLELVVRPHRVRFDDNQWHRVTVHRRVQVISSTTSFCKLSLIVDEMYAEHSQTAGSFTLLASSRVFVGGSEETENLPGSRQPSNFVGCLRTVEFTAEPLKLSLLELARTGSKLLVVKGDIPFICQEGDTTDPVSFTTPDSVLMVPTWEGVRSGSLSVHFRTIEPNGLLMFSQGANSTHPDMFALELSDGHLYVHMDLGSGPVKVRAPKHRVDDGNWHQIRVSRIGKEGRVTLDDAIVEFTTPGRSSQLELSGGLYIGGAPWALKPATWRYPAVWMGSLRQGFVGCIRDVLLDERLVQLAEHARHQDSGAIRPGCHTEGPVCDSQPCMNGGRCTAGWNRFICDCSSTSFTGPTCGKDAVTLSFNGSQYVWTSSSGLSVRSQAEELVFRFRSARPAGLLLATSANAPTPDVAPDRLEIALSSGRIRAVLKLTDREKSLIAGEGLNDNQWHTVRYIRRGEEISLQVDDEPAIKVSVPWGRGNGILEWQALHIGGWYSPDEFMSSSLPNFTGSLQQLSFNGLHYLDMAKAALHPNGGSPLVPIQVTAKLGKREQPLVHHPVTFKSKRTFVALPVLKAYSSTNIYFQFKTRQASGLLLYNAGRNGAQDFVCVELIGGHIHVVLDLGDGPMRIRDATRAPLNDNRWHTVTISRPSHLVHMLLVDDALSSGSSRGHSDNLDLGGLLYIGGVPSSMWSSLPRQVQSHHGYEGCLASLDLGGEAPNIVTDAVIPSTEIIEGCDGPSAKCSRNVCANHGICVQQWNTYACDCDLTSYTGPTCSNESISYEFGPGGGLITYTFPEERRPEMKSDVVALGFITSKEDAVLLRVDSATSHDYMELEIVDGNIYMVYNMGSHDHPVGDVSVQVNDHAYHVVRFTRSGPNSTIQIDDYDVQSSHPSGQQLSVFNGQAHIQVGGRWSRNKQKVERPFVGVLTGVVFNGLRLLDLASNRDPRTMIRGDVTQLQALSRRRYEQPQRTQQTQPVTATASHGASDDLVYSGAGSGCNTDDEDECATPIDSGSGTDDLITPVFVPPTRSPSGKGTVQPPRGGVGPGVGPGTRTCREDDEDCVEGSGEVGPDDVRSSSTGPVSSSTFPTSTVPDTSDVPTDISSPETGISFAPSDTTPFDSEEPSQGSTAGGTSSSEAGTSITTGSTAGSSSSSSSSTSSTTTTSSSSSSTTTEEPEEDNELPELPPRRPPQHIPPIQPIPTPPGKKRQDHERISSEAAENTALIIGVIAGLLIGVILIILVILKVKSRSAPSYKVGETAQHSPHAALIAQHTSPGPRNGAPPPTAANRRPKGAKDVKEWYV